MPFRSWMRRLGEPLLGLIDRRVHNLAKLTDAHAQEIQVRLKESQRESREELLELGRVLQDRIETLRPQIESSQQLLAAQQEALLESFAFLGRTLRDVREESAQTSDHVAALSQRLEGIVRQIEAPMERALTESSVADTAGAHQTRRFPAPALHLSRADWAALERSVAPPERRVEIPFVFHALGQLPTGASVLDIGGAASGMPLVLAGLGFHVTVVDPRATPLDHPQVTVIDRPFERWDAPRHAYQGVVWLWGEQAGLRDVAARLRGLATDDGILVATMPFGSSTEPRSDQVFDREQIERLLADWVLEVCTVVEQQSRHVWTVADGAGAERGRRLALIKARAS